MKLEDKLKLFVDRGWTCNPITGDVYSHTGNLIKNISDRGYITCVITTNNTTISVRAHQLIWFICKNEIPNEIDHINRIKSDNRIANLRNVDRYINNQNRKFKGYYYHKAAKKWHAKIYHMGKNIPLGFFDNEDDALKSYLDAKKVYHL